MKNALLTVKKKTVVIVPDVMDRTTWSCEQVDDVCAYIYQQFDKKWPPNTKIYHESVSDETEVTPRDNVIGDIEYLQSLEGTIYVVIHPSWLQFVYYAIVAIMALYSVYTIATMPKAQVQAATSSNNELANRSNQARIKGRICDMYGLGRSYPDLIGVPYTIFDDETGREIEHCIYVISRGYFKILDSRDGDTDVANIPGTSVSVYDPHTSIIGQPIYQVGDTFTDLPLFAKKSEAINGQTLATPNETKLENAAIYFQANNYIKNSGTIDFTKYFSAGDNIAVYNAAYGVSDVELSGVILVTENFHVIIETTVNIDNPNLFKGLLLTGALVEIKTVDDDGIETVTTRDISGQFNVSGVTRTTIPSGFHYDIVLSSPKQVNFNWNYVNDDYTISAGASLNKNEAGITLNGTYTINSVTSTIIALVNPSNINSEWDKLLTLPNQNTLGQTAIPRLDSIDNKWVGWFTVDSEFSQGAYFNLVWPQGLYWQSSSGRQDPHPSNVTIQYQQLDQNGNPIGQIFSKNDYFKIKKLSQFGKTLKVDFNFTGPFRFRICQAQWEDAQARAEVKIKDVYAFAPSDIENYGYVTVVRSKTIGTDGALSIKERKLNLLVHRKLRIDGVGEYVATSDAGQALIDIALDSKQGRRNIDEIDVNQIKSVLAEVKEYFGSDIATEFSYTFDDLNLSFEEQAKMVAVACFCNSTRFGSNKIKFKFERPQKHSVMLFNHRNKVPGTEKRTDYFLVENDYDGVELEYTSPDDDSRVTYKIPEDGSAINPMRITTSGIRNHAVAKTRAWREYNKIIHREFAVEFTAMDESELLQENDRLLNADGTDLETQDGEIHQVDGLALMTSQEVIFKSGIKYFCALQMSDVTVDVIECLPGDYTNQIILMRAPAKALIVDAGNYVYPSYVVVKADDVEKDLCMLSEMEPDGEITNKLSCVNYTDRYYEKDHVFI